MNLVPRPPMDPFLASEANAWLAAIVTSSHDAIISKNLESIITSWNHAAERLFGYTAGEMIGQPITRLFPPERHDEEIAIITRVKQGETVEPFESLRLTKDGRLIEVLITVSPIINQAGHVVGASKTARDISACKRAQEKHRTTEARYRALFENAPLGILVTSPHNILQEVNASLCQLLGYTRTELLQKQMTELVVPAEATQIESYLYTVKTQGEYRGEWLFVRQDGSLFLGEIVATRLPDGTLQSMIRDITVRKKNEQEIQEKEWQFRSMIDSISQLAWMAHPDGSIFWYNQRWYDYTGTTLDQMVGWGWQSVHDPLYLPQVVKRWNESLSAGVTFDMEFPLRAADGSYGWFLTRVHPVKDARGRVIRWFGSNTDITQKRQAEEKTRAINLELENHVRERTAELEAFTYSVSHDLRSPLRAMDGYTVTLLEDYAPLLPEGARHFLRNIRIGAKKMDRLIEGLLKLSRLSSIPLNKQEVDFDTDMRQVLDELLAELRGKRQVELHLQPLPRVQGNPDLLRQVWVNLLSNALKYSQHRPVTHLHIGYSSETGENIFYVRDNGTGFDMKYCHKLFGVFERLHRAEEFEGTGIGLALVRRILHKHGGKIWAQSEPDQGATFYFTLSPSPPHEHPPSDPAASGS